MKSGQSRVCLAAAILTLASACSNNPTTPSVSFSGPLASQPSNGTTYRFQAQPITITIMNAAKTGQAAVTYSIEVASDPGFTRMAFTKDGIVEGSGGATTAQIGNLPGGATYYWRSKAVVDGVVGPASAPQSFTVFPQVTINTPFVVSPVSGGTANSSRPSFIVENATRTGPAGPITYEFQVSSSRSFSPIITSATIPEQSGRTSWVPSVDLPETALYWRARARDDQNGEASGFNDVTPFSIRVLNINDVVWVNNPNLSTWAETTKITSVDFSSGYILVDFDRRTGPNEWPGVPFGGGSYDPLQYTLGMCFNLSGQWYCSAAIQFWPGRDLDASGPSSNIAIDWFYDARWGPMAHHQPAIGEQIGIFVANGNIRDSLSWSVEQRSDIAIMPFGTNYYR